MGSRSVLEELRGRVPLIPVTWTLIAVNIGVFLAMLCNGAGLWHSPNTVQLAWGANFAPATEDGQWWRLATALFLHFGLLHLTLNMLALWEAGTFVERMVGHWRFALIYFVSGLFGNLLSLVEHGGSAVAGGASGAVFGVYGVLLVYLWVSRRQLARAEFRWLFGGAAAFSVLTIVLGLVIPGIDNAAHLGGFGAGSVAAVCLVRPFAVGSEMPRAWRLAALGVLTAASAALTLAVPAPSYRWRDELAARRQLSEFVGEEQRISTHWQRLLSQGQAGRLTFEQLAGRVDSEITGEYDQSFEELSSLRLPDAAPSAAGVDAARRYVDIRRQASRELAQGLRAHDRRRIDAALDLARRAPALAAPAVSSKRSGRAER